MVLEKKDLPNFGHLDSTEGIIYGKRNKVTSVNPYESRFVATYPDGHEVRGQNLFNTLWDTIPQGIKSLRYELSTGHTIMIPRFRGYLPLICASNGMDGSRVFHSIDVKCLAEKEVIVYKIILKQDNISKLKIGDIVIGKEPLPTTFGKSWKFTT